MTSSPALSIIYSTADPFLFEVPLCVIPGKGPNLPLYEFLFYPANCYRTPPFPPFRVFYPTPSGRTLFFVHAAWVLVSKSPVS